MQSIKKESIRAIKKLPESTNIDDIMYRLYVIEKIRKGKQAFVKGEYLSVEELKNEVKKW